MVTRHGPGFVGVVGDGTSRTTVNAGFAQIKNPPAVTEAKMRGKQSAKNEDDSKVLGQRTVRLPVNRAACRNNLRLRAVCARERYTVYNQGIVVLFRAEIEDVQLYGGGDPDCAGLIRAVSKVGKARSSRAWLKKDSALSSSRSTENCERGDHANGEPCRGDRVVGSPRNIRINANRHAIRPTHAVWLAPAVRLTVNGELVKVALRAESWAEDLDSSERSKGAPFVVFVARRVVVGDARGCIVVCGDRARARVFTTAARHVEGGLDVRGRASERVFFEGEPICLDFLFLQLHLTFRFFHVLGGHHRRVGRRDRVVRRRTRRAGEARGVQPPFARRGSTDHCNGDSVSV